MKSRDQFVPSPDIVRVHTSLTQFGVFSTEKINMFSALRFCFLCLRSAILLKVLLLQYFSSCLTCAKTMFIQSKLCELPLCGKLCRLWLDYVAKLITIGRNKNNMQIFVNGFHLSLCINHNWKFMLGEFLTFRAEDEATTRSRNFFLSLNQPVNFSHPDGSQLLPVFVTSK